MQDDRYRARLERDWGRRQQGSAPHLRQSAYQGRAPGYFAEHQGSSKGGGLPRGPLQRPPTPQQERLDGSETEKRILGAIHAKLRQLREAYDVGGAFYVGAWRIECENTMKDRWEDLLARALFRFEALEETCTMLVEG